MRIKYKMHQYFEQEQIVRSDVERCTTCEIELERAVGDEPKGALAEWVIRRYFGGDVPSRCDGIHFYSAADAREHLRQEKETGVIVRRPVDEG